MKQPQGEPGIEVLLVGEDCITRATVFDRANSNPIAVQLVDSAGSPNTAEPARSIATSDATPVTTATDTVAVAAPGAGFHLKIYRLHAMNKSATDVQVSWRNGVAGALRFHGYLPKYGIQSLQLSGEFELSSATALYLNTSAAGSVHWTVTYETVPD